jgi:hypothetical protein
MHSFISLGRLLILSEHPGSALAFLGLPISFKSRLYCPCKTKN